MSMVFCRGCGKEIHETAETCPSCGAPQHIKKKNKYSSYDEVPFYRKNWYAIITFLFMWPLCLLSLITGPIYYEKDEELKTYSVAAKVVLIIILLLFIYALIAV